MADALTNDPRVARVCAFWETLTPAALAELTAVYTEDTRFRDPFNDLRGSAALATLLGHMFERLIEPRFEVLEVALMPNGAVLIWDFHYRIRAWRPDTPRRIHGASHLRFAPDGRVAEHRDYWDAAAEVYEHLPLVGGLMRWLRRRLA